MYQIVKFIVLSAIIVYALHFNYGMPMSLVLILEILLLIKLLPITQLIEKGIIRYYPKYKNLNIWVKRLILFAFYILAYIILKFVIVNVIMIGILNIPVEEQINDFISRVSG